MLESQFAAEQFEKANAGLESTLEGLPYYQFASDEVKEQVRLERAHEVL